PVQTGPLNGGFTGPVNGGIGNPAFNQKMTPDRLQDWLRQQGFQTRVNTMTNGDCTAVAEIQRDGWGYTIEFLCNMRTDVIEVTCPLTSFDHLSSEQAKALLRFGYEKCPVYFSMRGNVLMLEYTGFSARTATTQQLASVVEGAMRTVRETYN